MMMSANCTIQTWGLACSVSLEALNLEPVLSDLFFIKMPLPPPTLSIALPSNLRNPVPILRLYLHITRKSANRRYWKQISRSTCVLVSSVQCRGDIRCVRSAKKWMIGGTTRRNTRAFVELQSCERRIGRREERQLKSSNRVHSCCTGASAQASGKTHSVLGFRHFCLSRCNFQ